MKPSFVYTLKVCLATLIASVPLTMAIGFVYIGLIMLIKPANYNFTFNIPFNHMFIFVGIVAVFITFNIYLIEKMGYKRFINDRPIAHINCNLSFLSNCQRKHLFNAFRPSCIQLCPHVHHGLFI